MTDHLREATWEQLAMKELSPEARAEALRHVMACERCRTIFRGLRELEAGARAEGLLPDLGTRRRRVWQWIGGGVAVAAAAAALVLYLRRPQPTDDVVRGRDVPALTVEAPERVHAGDRLRWAPVPSAYEYRVEAFADDGVPVWTEQTPTTDVAWPAGQRSGPHRVRIEALSQSGEVMARSPLLRIEVAP